MDNKRTRRDFLRNTGTLAAASALPFFSRVPAFGNALDTKTLRVGLIGCGGRGTGAANQALAADDNVVLVAMADLFDDRLTESHANLTKIHPDKMKVDKSRQYLGFDGADKIINATDIDVVILTTPPYFRPEHFEKAVNAGKHIFCEKPMAVDAPGARRVMEAVRLAEQKKLNIMSGFCWRYHTPKRATFQKILDGAIGEVTTVYNTYNTGALWLRDTQPGWSKLRKDMRNWLYHTWISGDHLIEQAIHSVDMQSWALGDVLPASVTGTGGRQSRVEPEFGNVYDHFALVYEYDNGARGFHFSRQQKNCSNSYAVESIGTEGTAMVNCIRNRHTITGKESWKYDGEDNDMYQQEHDELFAAIRAGKPVNDGKRMVESTMLGIMGRMAAYTGQTITYEQAWNSQEKLGPDTVDEDTKWEDAPVAQPGITQFS
ncbi:MAG: Gfo/Idh/MocA family oxidoreductase [Imperialibacter sp.]|uniref:Gfo/Idh/MocA family protein n=1 Tax=Imperialibacter sp. TaxID=2038411 RepID=UPI0032EEA530